MLDTLNPSQRQAVLAPTSTLVLAGAGSGKTRVLSTRIALLLEQGIAPSHILALTFTNKAAAEMSRRIAQLSGISTRSMWVGTFHGMAHRLLRIHAEQAGLSRHFQILDADDQMALIRRLLKQEGVEAEDDKLTPRELVSFINHHKDQGRTPDQISLSTMRKSEDKLPLKKKLYELYEGYLEREQLLDFSDLMLKSHDLLERDSAIRQHYQSRFAHVLVDEFQDTSAFQYRWLGLLCGEAAVVFAVGDDDQSIYGFRGAEVGNMEQFVQQYAAGEVIRLEQNYRSSRSILEAANALIAHNSSRLGKSLWTAETEDHRLMFSYPDNEIAEADVLAGLAEQWLLEGLDPAECAILYRTNPQSRVIEQALMRVGVPYQMYGALKFFERQEVKDALAYFRLMANPADDGAFLRIVNQPARGIGSKTLEALRQLALRQQWGLYQASGQSDHSALEGFHHMLEHWRQQQELLPLPQLLRQVVRACGLWDMWRGTGDEELSRRGNLEELFNAAERFVRDSDDGSLGAFLAHLALSAGGGEDDNSNAIKLMTIHAAKGLEFHSVMLCGVEEGLCPHFNSLQQVNLIEEERRLMYVAITRAKRRLHLSEADSRMQQGKTQYQAPSRFLWEIPQPLWERSKNLERLRQEHEQSQHLTEHRRQRFDPYAQAPVARPAPISRGVGAVVINPKFGRGRVLEIEGQGPTALVTVAFDSGITKVVQKSFLVGL